MKTTYLKEFIRYSEEGVVYVPLGTIEWHGEHLPVETDFMVAQKICEMLSRRVKGYVLPPVYLATDKSKKIKGKYLSGMDRRLERKLKGSIYYLKPELFYKVVESLVQNLISQNYRKIIIVTGHGGSKQIETLERIKQNYREVVSLNPYGNLKEEYGGHADVGEVSLFWALFPEEAKKSQRRKIPKNNDCLSYIGHDPREKASLNLGKKILKEVIEKFLEEIENK